LTTSTLSLVAAITAIGATWVFAATYQWNETAGTKSINTSKWQGADFHNVDVDATGPGISLGTGADGAPRTCGN
jgi:hypothetical protein